MTVDVAHDSLALHAFLDHVPGYLALLTPDGTVDAASRALLDYCGLSLSELKDRRAIGNVHHDDMLPSSQIIARAVATGTAYECEQRLKRVDGTYCWFNHRGDPIRDASGHVTRWVVMLTDVDALKRAQGAQEALERSEAFLTHGEAVSETGSFLWRLDSGEIRWSNQLYGIFEFQRGTPITLERIGSRVHPEDLSMIDDMVARAQEGRGFRYEHRLLMQDGRVKYLHLVGRATLSPTGHLEYIGAVQDVTERRLAEQALNKVRSELAHFARVTSLNTLAASIAHEVNQPIAGIVTNASASLRMLAADPPNIEGAQATARRTIRDADRAAEVIKRLRAMFARRDTANEAIDLNEAAREVMLLSMTELERNRVVVRQEWARDLPQITGDRVQLQQVILNLVLNAADAMNNVSDRPRLLVVRTGRQPDGQVRLDVQDNGVGIDPESRSKLFEPFHTTKANGMGIGLSVSRSIVEAHHGRIWAHPGDGPGVTFSFSVPAREPDLRP